MTPREEKGLEQMSLPELAELLNYYNLYNTTKNTGIPRPSGPVLRKHLQRRLTLHAKDTPKQLKEPPAIIIVDLTLIYATPTSKNLLIDIKHTLAPYLHAGNKAMRRNPREYAREAILELMENGLLDNNGLGHQLFLLLFEGNYVPDPNHEVRCRGIDWVIYTQVTTIEPTVNGIRGTYIG